MEILLENNKLIAEFMGIKNLKDEKGDAWDYMHTGQSIFTLRTNLLKYHKDWSWIMGVVDKISEYRLAYPEEADKVCNLKIVVNISSLHSNCVEFIKFIKDSKTL